MTKSTFVAQAAEELRTSGVATENCGKVARLLWDAVCAASDLGLFTTEIEPANVDDTTKKLVLALYSFEARV